MAQEAAAVPRQVMLAMEPGSKYYVHVGTTNESFLRVSQKLRGKGVKNNKFMLALFDKELASVDPRSEALTDEVKARVLQEIVKNPWYFFREVLEVPVPGGKRRFTLHLGNLAMLWCMLLNINSFLVLPRQNYKTFSAAAFYLWVFSFATQNTTILFFNKEHGDSKNNLKRLKDMMALMPTWMRDVTVSDGQDQDNVEYIYSALRKNRIDAKPAGKDQAHANNLGRGSTTPSIWYDEAAFQRWIEETFMAAAPARSEASLAAKENGIPYGTCITTTPNNIDDRDGAFAHGLMTGSLPFREEFYDLGAARVTELMETQATVPYIFIQYDYISIGRSEAWFKQQCRELLNNRLKIKRELLLEWPLSGDNSLFTEEEMEALTAAVKPRSGTLPLLGREGNLAGLEIEFVESLDTMVPYLIGLDTSGNQGGGDYTAWVICHPSDFRVVGHMKTNTADHELVKAAQLHLMRNVMPHSIAIVERNHYLGIVVIEHMLKQHDLRDRVFYLKKVKTTEKTVGGKRIAHKGEVREYGVNVSATVREQMIRILFHTVETSPELLQLKAVADEVRTLHMTKSKKVEARPGCKDDSLFAWLHVQFAARHEQPVLRRLIRAQGGMPGFVNRAQDIVQANEGEAAADGGLSVPASGPREIDMEQYKEAAQNRAREGPGAGDAEAQRRRAMQGMVMSMNAGGDYPT